MGNMSDEINPLTPKPAWDSSQSSSSTIRSTGDIISPVQSPQKGAASDKGMSGNIRTMQQDLDALKRGGTPATSETVELRPEKTLISQNLPTAPSKPAVIDTFKKEAEKPPLSVVLGEPEKTKPLSSAPITIPPPKTVLGDKPVGIQSIKVPALDKISPIEVPKPKARISKGIIFGVVVVLILAGAAFWYLQSGEEGSVITETSSPTPFVATVQPTPLALKDKILNHNAVSFPQDADYFQSLADAQSQISVGSGEFSYLTLSDAVIGELDFESFLAVFGIIHPTDLLPTLDVRQWALLLFGQEEKFQAGVQTQSPVPVKKRALIAKVKSSAALRSVLNIWELTLAEDLSEFLEYQTSRAASEIFLDNVYKGVSIRYVNFPYPDESLDYAIVSSLGQDYLVFTSSRASMFAAIDALLAD